MIKTHNRNGLQIAISNGYELTEEQIAKILSLPILHNPPKASILNNRIYALTEAHIRILEDSGNPLLIDLLIQREDIEISRLNTEKLIKLGKTFKLLNRFDFFPDKETIDLIIETNVALYFLLFRHDIALSAKQIERIETLLPVNPNTISAIAERRVSEITRKTALPAQSHSNVAAKLRL